MRRMFFPVGLPAGIFGRFSLWNPHLASLCLSWGKFSNHGLKAFTSHASRRGLIQVYMFITLKPDSRDRRTQFSVHACQCTALGSILKIFQNCMKTIRINQDPLIIRAVKQLNVLIMINLIIISCS